MWNSQGTQQLTSLHTLNTALLGLEPSISGIDLSMLQVRGANLPMLDGVIAADNTYIANTSKRADIIAALKPALATAVNTRPIPFHYDPHGAKHFAGGPAGTKFTATAGVVNPALELLIAPHVGSVRRDANGRAQTYYLTAVRQPYTGSQGLAIQVDYAVSPTESITYHGYPASPTRFGMSRTLGGPAIAQ